MQQRALARPGDACHNHQHAERNVDINILQVVPICPPDFEFAGWFANLRLQFGAIIQMSTGNRAARTQSVERPLKADSAAVRPRTRTDIDNVIGYCDRFRLVLNHQHGIALVPQSKQQIVHPLHVVRMQTNRRLVETHT